MGFLKVSSFFLWQNFESLGPGVPFERGRQIGEPLRRNGWIDQDNLRMKFLALNMDFSSPSPDPPKFKEAGAGERQRRLPHKKWLVYGLPLLARVA